MNSFKMSLPSKLIRDNEFLLMTNKKKIKFYVMEKKHEMNQPSPFAFQLHSKCTFTKCLPEH